MIARGRLVFQYIELPPPASKNRFHAGSDGAGESGAERILSRIIHVILFTLNDRLGSENLSPLVNNDLVSILPDASLHLR